MRSSRYSRQILFAPIGSEGQDRLQQSKVLIVGLGALGTVLANHMVRSGVGYVRLVERNCVESSHLSSHMLFDQKDVEDKLPKVIAAERKLQKINSQVIVEGIMDDITATSIDSYAHDVDLILDGAGGLNNLHRSMMLNEYCFKRNIPFVYGAVVHSKGLQVTLIPGRTPCLRCLLNEIDDVQSTPNFNGDTLDPFITLAEIIASYQATEAIKWLVNQKDKIRSSLLMIDMYNNEFHERVLLGH